MTHFVLATSFVEEVTLGQVLVCLTFVLSLTGAVLKGKKVITDSLTKWLNNQIKPELEPIHQKLTALEKRAERQDMEACKNYLVLFMSDLERGAEPDEVELDRFEEQFKYYTDKGGNSYIHRKYDKLKTEGKL